MHNISIVQATAVKFTVLELIVVDVLVIISWSFFVYFIRQTK